MTLSVKDIVNDLGVTQVTVWRWISDGKIKASRVNRRLGWKIEEADYMDFLNRHSRWQALHNRLAYNGRELKARENALVRLSAKIISMKLVTSQEQHSKEYISGFERAITDIQAAINREMIRRTTGEAEIRD